ncbi:MAG: MFS transporter, partial [Chloroflexi bacterium]|nr:MFS transporter [Chloroflexota bacterium]
MIAKPARHRIYYGWYIVLALFFLGFSKAGFTGFLFSLFLKPMTEEFGWSRTAMTGAVTFGTILAAALGYWIGSTIDRHGARLPMSVATFFAGGAFLGLGFVNGLFTYYLVYGLGRAVTQSALGDAMVAAVISKWFLRLRGFTIALGNMGAAVAGTILAVVCQALIESYSWRYAWAFLGVLTLIVSLPPLLIFLRRSPEDMGLAIFGAGKEPLELASPPASQHGEAVYNREYSLTLRQAL